jgi:hypothetical protein
MVLLRDQSKSVADGLLGDQGGAIVRIKDSASFSPEYRRRHHPQIMRSLPHVQAANQRRCLLACFKCPTALLDTVSQWCILGYYKSVTWRSDAIPQVGLDGVLYCSIVLGSMLTLLTPVMNIVFYFSIRNKKYLSFFQKSTEVLHPLDISYQLLGCDLTLVQKETPEYKVSDRDDPSSHFALQWLGSLRVSPGQK